MQERLFLPTPTSPPERDMPPTVGVQPLPTTEGVQSHPATARTSTSGLPVPTESNVKCERHKLLIILMPSYKSILILIYMLKLQPCLAVEVGKTKC